MAPVSIPRGRARARARLRRRRSAVLALVLAAAVLVGVDLARGSAPRPTRPAAAGIALRVPPPATLLPQSAPTRAQPSPTPPTTRGSGTFRYADGQGSVLGTAGALRRFRIAVEDGTAAAAAEFAAAADAVLGDPRSWIASGQLRFQRVPRNASAEFTIYLATPATSTRMCAAGGLDTNGYTSCRLPGQVIINLARWTLAVPGYGASLAVYRAYALNHEVGHQLGYGHEACPGPGRPAPVMQQQTLGLKGCVANGWPYVDGRRYSGAPAA
ncbi:MAG TPA: DUF3152 domain-containing protein [Micromonosporaceae bacterium]|nr:DUF3152 domain-containing protein [Micromonosporaceae bacterium]